MVMLDAESVRYLINPWSLSLQFFFGLYVLKCGAIMLLDQIIEGIVHCRGKPKMLGYKVNHPNVKGLAKLEVVDFIFLVINSMIEFVFVTHVAMLMWTSSRIIWTHDVEGLLQPSMLLQFPALWLLFAVDDFMYALAHKTMHHRLFYAYIHKHHHRQNFPSRGYVDAGNEHPFEQLIGLGLLWITIMMVSHFIKIHVATLTIHFLLYAALAVLNHTQYDIKFSWLGFEYTVGAHEMHHRHPQCNMAQYMMTWDRLMGTYREYADGKKES